MSDFAGEYGPYGGEVTLQTNEGVLLRILTVSHFDPYVHKEYGTDYRVTIKDREYGATYNEILAEGFINSYRPELSKFENPYYDSNKIATELNRMLPNIIKKANKVIKEEARKKK